MDTLKDQILSHRQHLPLGERVSVPQGWLLLLPQPLGGLGWLWLLDWLPPWLLSSQPLGCAITSHILSDVNTLCDQEAGEVSRWYLSGYRARRIRTSCYNSTLNIFSTTKENWWLKSTYQSFQSCLLQEPNLHLLTFPVSTAILISFVLVLILFTASL